jgi:hypothetical protein
MPRINEGTNAMLLLTGAKDLDGVKNLNGVTNGDGAWVLINFYSFHRIEKSEGVSYAAVDQVLGPERCWLRPDAKWLGRE